VYRLRKLHTDPFHNKASIMYVTFPYDSSVPPLLIANSVRAVVSVQTPDTRIKVKKDHFVATKAAHVYVTHNTVLVSGRYGSLNAVQTA